MSKHQTKITDARGLAEDIETMTRELEILVNGKEGFLKDLRKETKDIGVQRFNEDVFMLKNLAKHVFEIMNYIEQISVDSDGDNIDANEDKYDNERLNRGGRNY